MVYFEGHIQSVLLAHHQNTTWRRLRDIRTFAKWPGRVLLRHTGLLGYKVLMELTGGLSRHLVLRAVLETFIAAAEPSQIFAYPSLVSRVFLEGVFSQLDSF